jgi:hypothetical protein
MELSASNIVESVFIQFVTKDALLFYFSTIIKCCLILTYQQFKFSFITGKNL